MALFPEKEPEPQISERPEGPEIPPYIEAGGVKPVPSQFTANVKGDNGKPIITPSQTSVMQVPADEATLASWSKGPITSSLTWFANFWLRMIKKAFYFGIKVVKGGS